MKIFLWMTFILFVGCQSKPLIDRYYDVEIGAHKGDVLATLGSPRSSRRISGLDHWYYNLRPGHRNSRRVLIFDEGFLSYKGPLVPPPITAAEADQLKKPRVKAKPKPTYKRALSDKALRQIIKKDMKVKKQKKDSYEPI